MNRRLIARIGLLLAALFVIGLCAFLAGCTTRSTGRETATLTRTIGDTRIILSRTDAKAEVIKQWLEENP